MLELNAVLRRVRYFVNISNLTTLKCTKIFDGGIESVYVI